MESYPVSDDQGAGNSPKPAGTRALTGAQALFSQILLTLVKTGAIPLRALGEQTTTPQADEPKTR